MLGEHDNNMIRPAGEEVYRTLRSMIFSGELKYEEHLVERKIAEMLSVSRTPVREALRKLETEGLVKRVPYRGLVVSKFTPQEAVEIFEIREVLEGLATQLAASRRGGEFVPRIEELLEQMNDASANNDDMLFVQLHGEFHSFICRAANRPKLYNLIKSVQEHTDNLPHIGYRLQGRCKQAAEEHREMFQRIRAGDAVAAGEIARIHIRHSKDALLAVLSKGNDDRKER